MKADRITKLLLAIIAALLGTLTVRPVFHPDRVRADSAEIHPFFVEPGYTTIRKPDGSAQIYGKIMIRVSERGEYQRREIRANLS